MKKLKKLILVILCAALLSALTYVSAFACSADEAADDVIYISGEAARVYADSDYSSVSSTAGIKFNSLEEYFYNQIKDMAADVASGSTTYASVEITTGLSELSWTAEELGCTTLLNGNILTDEANQAFQEKFSAAFDTSYILSVLLVECPYEMYWFDKTGGIGCNYNISATSKELSIASLTLSLYVSDDYREGNDYFAVDSDKISTANQALAKINNIVKEHESKSDYDKLVAYKDEICELVSYNFDALTSGVSYGNPWQLIYVFDGDPNTNVVCEGYAKAFKYLCDLSDFEKDIYCYITSGEMTANKSENHMWNVVKIGSSNYIVDITNTDSTNGSGGFDLFLVGADESSDGTTYTVSVNGQTIRSIVYEYADTQKDLFCEGYLAISETEYQDHINDHFYGSSWISNDVNHWHECSCAAKSDEAAHTPLTPATCTEKAVCSICGVEYGELLPHNLDELGECDKCGFKSDEGNTEDSSDDDSFTDDGLTDGGYDDGYDSDYDDGSESDEPSSFLEWLIEIIISLIKMLLGIEEE